VELEGDAAASKKKRFTNESPGFGARKVTKKGGKRIEKDKKNIEGNHQGYDSGVGEL